MADARANIQINVDTSQALASIRALQAEISTLQQRMLKVNAATAANAASLQSNLISGINATGKFSAGIQRISTTTETFTNALEKNKLSMGEYFRYAGGASRTFGRLFRSEFDTIEKVARERVKTLQTQYIKLGRDANGALKAISVRPLALDMQNLGTQTMMAAQRQQLFNQLLKQGSTNLLNWGKNTQWAGRQLMVGFTVPLTIFGTVAARAFSDLEEQAIRFKRVYGELFTAPEEADEMLDMLKQLSTEFAKYGVALKDTMAMAADAAAMGKMGTDLLAQVEQASRLAVLGGVEQKQALETTISLTNTFGVAAEDLSEKIAFLNAVENQTVVSIEDLTVAIPKAGPVIQQLGGDVEDLAFFLTAMKEGGINASEGANALKSGLASLINPTEKASEMLAGLGINIRGIVEANAGDVKGTVVSFAQALDTLDPLNRARAIEQLFGKFQFSRLSTLFQNVVAEGNQASRVLKLTAASTEELAILAERELKRVEESPLFKFRKAWEELQGALAPVGEQFLKAITPILEFGTKLLEKFNQLGDGGKQFVTILVAGLGVVAPTLLMIVGLVGNGVANLIKFFGWISQIGKGGAGIQHLGLQTQYMTQEQLEANTVAAALNQTHMRLQQTFTSEAAAVNALAAAYQRAAAAHRAMAIIPGSAGTRGFPAPKGYASGILSVPGPKGAGDIVPAMLSPGEAVIPAKQARKHAGFISSIIQDKIPGFFRGVFLGMPKPFARVAKDRDASDLIASRFTRNSKVPVVQYGHQIAPTTGHSFPIPGVGGVYAKADGSKVFVKPFVDEKAALAEMRASEIARNAHGLLAPKHTLVRIPDPTDLSGKRTFFALESKLDPMFASPTGRFTKGEMIKQLLASLLRADKDLSPGNMFGRVLTDPGPAGVFTRASGIRDLAKPGTLPSLAQQAEINLLGVKGGARKFFAQATSDIARGMTAKEYQAMMLREIDTVLPRLKKTIAGFNLKGPEKAIYDDMIKRLEDGRNVDWTRFHKMHSDVAPLPPRPLELADGIFSVPGPKGAGDVVPAMLSPGEAVIPAKQSQKHMGLIKGIITDSIPGYAKSNLSASDLARSVFSGDLKNPRSEKTITRMAQSFDNLAKKLPGGLEQLQKELKTLGTKVGSVEAFKKTDLYKELHAQRSGRQFAHVGSGKKIPANQLAAMLPAGAAKQYASDMAMVSPGSQLALKSKFGFDLRGDLNQYLASAGGANIKDVLDDVKKTGSAKWAKAFAGAGIDVNDPKIKKSLDAYERRFQKQIQGMQAAGITRLVDTRDQIGGRKGFGSIETAEARAAKGLPAILRDARATLLNTGLMVRGIANQDFNENVVRGTQSKNPAIEAAAKRLMRRHQIYVDDDGVARTGKKNVEAKLPASSAVAIDKNTDAVKDNTVANKKTATATTDAAKSNKKVWTQAQKDANSMAMYGKPASEVTKEDRDARKEAQRINKQSRLGLGYPVAAPIPAGAQQAGSRGGMGMGAVGMLAMTGGMMAPMLPGKAGEIGSQLAMPLMAAGMISMLPTKIALVVGSLAALGAGIYAISSSFNKASKEAFDLATSLGSGTKAIEGFSNFAGTVSAGELMDRRRENMFTPYEVQPGKTTFGAAFVQSEDGAALIESLKTATESQDMKAIQRQVLNQMATAVATGALSAEQARSVVYSLAQELGDVSFGIEVNGRLTELIGPNGERLLRDPLMVRVEMVQEAETSLQSSFEALDTSKVGEQLGAGIGSSIVSSGLAAVMGANIGATIGTAVLPGAGSAVGAAIGGLAGGTIGFLANLPTMLSSLEDLGAMSGAINANSIILLQQRQQLLDSLDVEYEKRIENARAAGDLLEVERLIDEQRTKREDFLAATADAFNQIGETYSQAGFLEQGALSQNINEILKNTFADSPLMQMQVAGARAQIEKLDGGLIDTQREYQLKVMLASEDIDPAVLSTFLASFGEDQATVDAFINVMTNLGTAEGNRTLQVMNMFKDDTQKTQFLATVSTKAPGDAQNYLDMFMMAAQTDSAEGVNLDTVLTYYLENEDAAKEYEADMVALRAEAENGPITTTFIQTLIGTEVADIVRANQEYFDSLDPLQQVVYLQTVRTVYETATPADIDAFLKTNPGKTATDYYHGAGFQLTQQPAPPPNMGEEDQFDSGGGGGATERADDLLKKLRDLRIATIEMKKGWEGMQQVLDKVFAGGSRGIDVFSGLSNQIRKMGVGENLIEMIVGMDPDEYEKKKKDLFVFDKAGNIVGTTAKLKNMQAAFNAIAIGEYVNSQQQFIQNTKNQISAISILTANGMSLAEAYQVVQDEALAAAIAMGATKAEIQEILRITKIAQDFRRRSEAEEKRANAAKAVRETNEEFARRVAVLDKLAKSAGKYTDEQINAILSDTNLQQLFLDPSIDRRALNQAIANASRNAEIELKVKLATTEGKKTIFDEAFGNAMQAFSAQEQKINLKFQADIADEENIIKQAENQIAALQFQLDDYEAELTRIEEQEQDINDSYDKRFEALDRVAEANDRIAASQKSQLDIADALSRGDIAAAARAAQEARAKQADFAVQSERDMLERTRDAQIAGLTGRGGQTREQIEENMRKIRMQIFNIEEDQLEPAQENIRLAEILRDQEIESLMVLGKTREEWDTIQNSIDMAQINNWKFVESMQAGLDVVQQLIAELGMAKPIPVEPEPEPSGGGGGGGGGPAPTPPPVPTRNQSSSGNISNMPSIGGGPPTPRPIVSSPNMPSIGGGPARTSMSSNILTDTISKIMKITPSDIAKAASSAWKWATTPINIPAPKPTAVRTLTPPKSTRRAMGGMIKMAMGGKVKRYAAGGMFKPFGTDIVPAMLTPGEFVIRRPAVSKIGVDKLEKINRGSYGDGAVYNYNLAVNVKSDADPSKIAQTVIREIKRVDSQRIRGNKF